MYHCTTRLYYSHVNMYSTHALWLDEPSSCTISSRCCWLLHCTVVTDDGAGQCCCSCSCMEVLSRKRWSYRKDGRISRVNSTAVISNLQGWLIMLHYNWFLTSCVYTRLHQWSNYMTSYDVWSCLATRGVEQFDFNARGLEVIDVRGGLYKHQ